MKKIVIEILKMTFADAIVSAAVFFFLMPSHASVSSIAGLAIVLENFVPLSVSIITMILNAVLLVVGFFTCGSEFGLKTVYTAMMMPFLMWILEQLFPNFQSLTGDPTLDVACYIFTVSIGVSMLFNMNASSGGLDIVAKVMNKYLHMDLGKAMGLSGLVVALCSAFVYPPKIVALSLLGTYLNGIIIDHYIFDQNMKKRISITSPKEEEIRDYILHTLGSGATIYEAYGAYHMKKHNEIIVIVDKQEYQKLMNYLQITDPDAFITVYNVSAMQYRSKKLAERIY